MGSIVELDPTALCGNWLLDKKQSDDIAPILKLQGLGWLMRKAICAATMFVTFAEQKEDESSDVRILFDTTLKGIYTLKEGRTLDWAEKDHTDDVFGEVIIQSRLVSAEKAENGRLYVNVDLQTTIAGNTKAEADAKNYLRDGTLPNGKTQEQGKRENVYLHDYIRSKSNGWTMEQVWGLETINGQKYLTRHAVVTKESSFELRRCIYSPMAQDAA